MAGVTAVLQPGDAVPHFTVCTTSGTEVHYATLWQHTNLVLVTLPSDPPASVLEYGLRVEVAFANADAVDVACVVTRDPVNGLPAPGVLVADRWGEVVHVATSLGLAEMPAPDDLRGWVDYTRQKCPECEGEAW